MADWDEEYFEPAAPGLVTIQPKNQWDDEDMEDENIKESWEDEEDTMEAPKPEQAANPTVSKTDLKIAGKKDKLAEAKIADAAIEVLADSVAEKLHLQRLVEEADYRSTAELFAKKGDQKTIDNFIPKSENDFLEYAELLSYRIHPYEKSFHYIGLLKAVLRLSMTSLKAADAKEIAASASAIANEKLKAEKEANAGKKKQGAKKKQLQVDKAVDDYSTTGGYDNVDDYDFIISWLAQHKRSFTKMEHKSTMNHESTPRGGGRPPKRIVIVGTKTCVAGFCWILLIQVNKARSTPNSTINRELESHRKSSFNMNIECDTSAK